MKAMILAAGLGTRLRPLTDTRPKALVEINGRTLLEITLARLHFFGINEVIVNVHHFADMVVDYLKSRNNFGMRIEISREDDLLLDTGGGLKKAAWFLIEGSRRASVPRFQNKADSAIPSEARDTGKASSQSHNNSTADDCGAPDQPFLLHNVDVISNIDLHRVLQFHNEHGALATLAVQLRQSSRLLLFNDQLQLVSRATPEKADSAAAKERVIPSAARNPGKTVPQPASDPTPEAFPTQSPLTAPLPRSSSEHSPLAFSGIHVISPRLLPMLTETGVFSIIDAYLRLADQGEKILAFRADEYYWRDLGRPADLAQAALDLQQKNLF